MGERVLITGGAGFIGRSMYGTEHYASINAPGTAVLLPCTIDRPVDRVEQATLELEQRGLTL